MGAILAKFRKEKTTEVFLEELENNINEIEKYSYNTQEQKKRVVGNFLAVSIGVYVVAFIIFYFVYFPCTWRDRIIYSMPLLIFPFVIILLRRLFTWYFERQLKKNSRKLSELRAEKKRILEQVMDKETYKVAVNLLARFGDKTNGAKLSYGMSPRPIPTTPLLAPYKHLSTLSSSSNTTSISSFPSGSSHTPIAPRLLAQTSSGSSGVRNLTPSFRSPQQQMALTPQIRSGQELRRRTPFPIIDQQCKSVLERIVDVLVGDGPQDRFAMICKECSAHNGMALKEEFEYTSYRCAFCNAMNPSRKARPVAPRLPDHQHLVHKSGTDNSSSSPSSDEESGKIRTHRHRKVSTNELTESNISTPRGSAENAAAKSESEVVVDAEGVDKNQGEDEGLDDVHNNNEAHDGEQLLSEAELLEREIRMSKLQDEFKKLMPEIEKSEAFTSKKEQLETTDATN